jgi:hypothetical protein
VSQLFLAWLPEIKIFREAEAEGSWVQGQPQKY